MTYYVLGIDCAAKDNKSGLALGRVESESLVICNIRIHSKGDRLDVLDTVRNWLHTHKPIVLAMDAPLGWPQALGLSLVKHVPGNPLDQNANKLFRRATDNFVREKTGKQPLDVGADKIARVSEAALRTINELRHVSGFRLPVLEEPGVLSEPGIIEVYPAATLRAHGLSEKGYKKKAQSSAREALINGLSDCMRFLRPEDRAKAIESDNALDAAICAIAAADFLHGNVHFPPNHDLARKEGWIWFFNSSSSSP